MAQLPPVAGWRPALLEVGAIRLPGADLAADGSLGESVAVPTNVLLLRGHGMTVLVDAGEGILRSWYPVEGPGLAAALGGVRPDLVVLTHLDFDHVGGTLAGRWPDELRPAFAGVAVVLLAGAAAGARNRDPDEPWNARTRAVAMLERAGLLREVADGDEVAPGMRLRAAPGHRSGHALVEVGESLVHLADVIHHPVHVEHPDWDGAHDGDRELALRTRVEVLARAAERGTTCVASHVRGAGRVERTAAGLRWRSIGLY